MKNLFRSIYVLPVLFFLLLGLTSCGGGGGGGGGGGDTGTGTTTQQGKFIDTAVEGIAYTSGSLSGFTGPNGEFEYESGQDVTFSIGDIIIGTVSGSATITPVQLILNNTNPSNPYVTNIVQFLLTVDADHSVLNGGNILITPAIHAAAAGLSVNFSSDTFDANADVSTAVDALVTASGSTNINLVSEADAATHLSSSLFSVLSGVYSGTYTGQFDNGTWIIEVDINGDVIPGNSTVTSAIYGLFPYNVTGAVDTSGVTTTSIGSGTAGTATWSGIISITSGAFSGTWNDPSEPDNGTFSGSKQ